MKQKIVTAILMTFIGITAFAQHEVGRFSVIPRLGLSIANISNSDIYYEDGSSSESKLKSRYKAGLLLGADVEYQATQTLSVSLGLLYSLQGNDYADHQTYNPSTNTYNGIRDFYVDLHYLNVPLMVNCYVAPGLAVKLGLQPAFLLDSKEEYEQTSFVINEDGSREYGETTKIKNDTEFKKFDLSIPVGLSYEFSNVILDARYNIGLLKINKLDLSEPNKNRFFTFTVGYRFGL